MKCHVGESLQARSGYIADAPVPLVEFTATYQLKREKEHTCLSPERRPEDDAKLRLRGPESIEHS